MKNRKNIAMRCTQEQFEAIKPKLENSGIKIIDISKFELYNYLTNNFQGCISVSNVSKHDINCFNRENHEEWNENVFLSACGIEVEPVFEITKEQILFLLSRCKKGGKAEGMLKEWFPEVFESKKTVKISELPEYKLQTQKETDFNKVVEDTLINIQELLLVKGIEYRRNNDPFHNFSIGSQMTGQIPEKVLHGFLLKHLVSYQDMLNDLEKGILPTDELIQSKFNDILVYFIIQKAMFLDRIENRKNE